METRDRGARLDSLTTVINWVARMDWVGIRLVVEAADERSGLRSRGPGLPQRKKRSRIGQESWIMEMPRADGTSNGTVEYVTPWF